MENEKSLSWFDDQSFRNIIENNLPLLFKEAELETTRGGKIGMEVGTLRERILIACMIKCFGETKISTDFGVAESSKDVKVFEDIISIKTFSNDGYGGLKIFWASDNETVNKTIENYVPQNNLLITNIRWGKKEGGVFLIPLDVQNEFFQINGAKNYLKKNSGNNRGISINKEILVSMLKDPRTKKIEIDWILHKIPFNIYERWIQKII